jgi:uncharacterized SAM-binding protein YcdF (DUF218 family)
VSFDAIVVLGAALAADGGPGPALAERIAAGAEAFHRGLAKIVVMTGALEAQIMCDRAVTLGVPREAILLEPTALTTRTNAVACAALLHPRAIARVAIVTQPYHRRRAVAAFRKVGFDAEAVAFASRRNPPRQRLREIVARAHYRLRGWI